MNSTVVLASARTPFGRLGGALAPLPRRRSAPTRFAMRSRAPGSIRPRSSTSSWAGAARRRRASPGAASRLQGRPREDDDRRDDQQGLRLGDARGRVRGALIDAGDHDVVVAGGMESMSNAPYLLPRRALGYRFGNGKLVDAMVHDGLLRRIISTRRWRRKRAHVAAELGVTRARCKTSSPTSRTAARTQRTKPAISPAEIAPIRVATKAKGKIVVDACRSRRASACRRTLGGRGDGVGSRAAAAHDRRSRALRAVRDRRRAGARSSTATKPVASRRLARSDGEAAAARTRRHDHRRQRAGRERRRRRAGARRARLRAGATASKRWRRSTGTPGRRGIRRISR